MSQHVVGSRLTSNFEITLKIKFTSQIFADISRSLVVVLQHLRFCKKILILIFFSDLFSIECKFFCPNSADNTMENRAISLVESSRDNSLISCPTSSAPASDIRSSKISRHFHCYCFENTNGLWFVFKAKLTLEIKRKHLKDILR